MSDIAIAALLAGTILIASMVSIEVGHLGRADRAARRRRRRQRVLVDVPSWLTFVGSFAGIVLTFLAGAEVDVPQFRREWKASLSIGLVSFFAPFAVVGLLAYYGLGWNHHQAEIGGLALSTTSLAVVYAVLVETGLNRELVGKRIMSATFVTDIATVTGLTILFITPTIWIVPFVLVSIGVIVGPAEDRAVVLRPVRRPRDRARDQARVRGALPADVARRPRELAGRAAGVRPRPRDERPLRSAPPRAGADARRRVRVPDAVLLPQGRDERLASARSGRTSACSRCSSSAKMVPKLVGVYPLARRYAVPHATFTTLLMSTGLTFGTITSLYGLNAGIIDRTQFSLLIAVVVLSAIVPTAIAQRFFDPGKSGQLDPTAPAPLPPPHTRRREATRRASGRRPRVRGP